MSNETNTCRLCKNWNGDKIRYGTRHYAHADCALTKWGAAFFQKLHLWQQKSFPAIVAKRHGLLEDLERAIENHPEFIKKDDRNVIATSLTEEHRPGAEHADEC